MKMRAVGGILLFLGMGVCPALATEVPIGIVIPAKPKASKEAVSMPFGIVMPEKESNKPPEVGGLWYENELRNILKANNCHAMSQHQKDYPFYQLLTPEILVTWCIENVPRDPLPPNFHLVIIPRSSTHPWAVCPRFFPRPYNSNPSYVWIEKPTTFQGQPWPLRQLFYQSDDDGEIRQGPKGVLATGPSLWYGERGANAALMYCYQGVWLHGSDS